MDNNIGTWIVTFPFGSLKSMCYRKCSCCGDARHIDIRAHDVYDKYCPECGARMLKEA